MRVAPSVVIGVALLLCVGCPTRRAGRADAPLSMRDPMGMKIFTTGGYVEFTVGGDWAVLSMQSTLPIATAMFQIPNPADAGTPDSTNLVLLLFDPRSEIARAKFDAIVLHQGSTPIEQTYGPWTTFRQEADQGATRYTILDAKRVDVGDVSASVRLAWPHLKENAAGYDESMEAMFREFLNSVEGKLGPNVPQPGEVIRRPTGSGDVRGIR